MQFSKSIFITLLSDVFLTGCATQSPPTRTEIHRQSGTLTNLTLTNAWKAAVVSANAIQDNWLAMFGDAQLDALVAEARNNNPDLRVRTVRGCIVRDCTAGWAQLIVSLLWRMRWKRSKNKLAALIRKCIDAQP
jgi:hypothetical protein